MLKTLIRICLMGIALYCIPVSAQAELLNHTCVIGQVALTVWKHPADTYARPRVLVRCKDPAPGGTRVFIYKMWGTSSGEYDLAQMVLSILNTAKVADRPVVIRYESTDRTAEDDNCKFPICRGFRQIRW